jgi:uncharacterized protein with HEPN domain
MPSDRSLAVLIDIIRNIDLAGQFIADVDIDRFRTDRKTLYAVIRCLEIISEASRRLPDDMKSRHPQIAWRDIAGAGNIYRHDYEEVSPDQAWNTVLIDLPLLRTAIHHELH